MKKRYVIVCMLMIINLVTGCGSKDNANSKIKNSNPVDTVIQNQIDKSMLENTVKQDESASAEELYNSEEQVNDIEEAITSTVAESDLAVDIDMTVMSSDMIYATVYQLVVDPDSYTDKIIRIKGNYYSTYYEPTDQIYHYAIIQDATACCAQGLEFVLKDSNEYPEEDEEIVVTGRFEAYAEEGYLYCKLSDAVIENGLYIEEDMN